MSPTKQETETEEIESLRKSVAYLEAELKSRENIIKSKNSLIESKENLISVKDLQIAHLNQQLDWLRKKVFGKMSEKKHLPVDPSVLNQPSLFPEEMSPEEKTTLLDEVKKSDDLS